jgi:biotin-(acetyl-CoA carboxylase) ligase
VEGTVVISSRRGSALDSRELKMSLILRPRRRSGLEILPLIGALSIAQGVRKATGVVAEIQPPGKVIVEERTIGNAFSRVKVTESARQTVLLGMRLRCRIQSRQLGDLLADSPWPRNTLFVDPEILREKILESFEWLYSEWERGLDTILRNRIAPISHDFPP